MQIFIRIIKRFISMKNKKVLGKNKYLFDIIELIDEKNIIKFLAPQLNMEIKDE